MRLSYLLLIIPLFLTVACSSKQPLMVQKDEQPITVIRNDFAKVLDNNFRGLLYLRKGQAYFKRCGSEKSFTVIPNEALKTIYKKITSKKLSPVYIEFTGEIIFPNEKQNASDVVMRIDRIFHMELAEMSLQCAKTMNTYRFKAKGDNPYWRLNIDGQTLYFATKIRNQVYQIQDANFQTTQTTSIKSINKLDGRLNLIVEPGDCYNVKNNEYWGYIAKVETHWGNLQGCGESGWPTLEQKFTGYYLSQTLNQNSNLTINENYTVEYKEQVGKKTILKTGFWKSNSPDRVVIMLTRRANKRIREELILDRKGLSLSTQKINKNHRMTILNAPGLIFKKMNTDKGLEGIVAHHVARSFTPQFIDPQNELDLNVQKAVNQYFAIHRTDPKNTQFNTVKYDLNGDGIKEAIVLLDWCSKEGCEMLVFEGQKSGYRFSSRVSRVKAPITIGKTQHYLWQSLLMDINDKTLKLDFDGISYPVQTRDLKAVNKQDNTTGVVLFSQGIPENWFPVKL